MGLAHRMRARAVTVVAAATTVVLVAGGALAVSSGSWGNDTVGSDGGRGVLLPDGQRVSPAGTRHLVNGRLLSSTVSPDGMTVAALTALVERGFLTLMDAATGRVVQQVGMAAGTTFGDGTAAADGPFYSPDGKTLWFPQTSDLLRFTVLAGGMVDPSPTVIPLTDAKTGHADMPSGMAFSPDGAVAYVALNAANTLGVIDTSANTLVAQIPVGNAPRQVVVSGGRAFVSNEGGRPARPGDFTNLTDVTPVVADASTGGASTGTVSVVDLGARVQRATLPVGLQPTAEHLAKDGTLFVTNSNDDTVSLIDTATERVVQTINVNPLTGSTVGSHPNAVTMADSSTVLVSLGRDNAIAEYHYRGARKPLEYRGLIPTDWYPVGVVKDGATGQIIVTNDKGIGSRGPTAAAGAAAPTITYEDTGSFTTFAPRTPAQLEADTRRVFVNNTWDKLLAHEEAPVDHSVTAVPTKRGQRSPIDHVFLIVKENRTYDQVYGDMGKGNSDPALTQFGQHVTPNQHALANTFGLFDNFYDEGTLSADGHNWLMQADANDYVEKQFGAFYRSYPAQGGDALAYQPNGFLWNAAARAGKTARSFGEYNNFITFPGNKPPTWSQWYHDSQVLDGKATGPLNTPVGAARTYADIPSLNDIDDHSYPMFDLDIPDQYRYSIWNRSFQQSLQKDNLPNLNMLWVMCDHTSGAPSDPNPVAEVADNDLAVGRIVDTITHSKVWPTSAIFVVEDDPQNGADHVDGHRSGALVISPYIKRNVVNSTFYTQVNMVRTIEAILGIAPMNQLDRAAVPMTDAFTDVPDLTPYAALPNEVPLNLGLDPTQAGYEPSAGAPGTATAFAPPAAPAAMRSTIRAWQQWAAEQHFGGRDPRPDYANARALNRYDFYAATGWTVPYPGDTRVLRPNEVPGGSDPTGYLGDD